MPSPGPLSSEWIIPKSLANTVRAPSSIKHADLVESIAAALRYIS